ncbi:MAG: hypothetical protein P8075_06415 [Deltaproteobacteria bacterium]
MEKNRMKSLLVLVSAILIMGCASGPLTRLPTIEDEKRSGEVTLIRTSNFIGVAVSYIITLNGAEIFGIRSGQYTKFKLNEGEYEIGVKCFGGSGSTWRLDSIRFNATSNSNSYFLVSPNYSCAGIKQITEAEALKRIQNSKYISMEQQ